MQGAERFPFLSKKPDRIRFKAKLVAQSFPAGGSTHPDLDEEASVTKAQQELLKLRQKEVLRVSPRTPNSPKSSSGSERCAPNSTTRTTN